MKIERPDWFDEVDIYKKNLHMGPKLSEWFDARVEPINKLLSEGVEVYGFMDRGKSGNAPLFYRELETGETHKALLIKITPIKKETAEDVLRELCRRWNEDVSNSLIMDDLIDRAKAALEREE